MKWNENEKSKIEKENVKLPDKLVESCTQWGIHTGIAYQILDDVSELILSPMETGKDSLRDMREGRLSVPLFLLRETTSKDEWKDVQNVLKNNSGSDFGDRRLLSKVCSVKFVSFHFGLIRVHQRCNLDGSNAS